MHYNQLQPTILSGEFASFSRVLASFVIFELIATPYSKLMNLATFFPQFSITVKKIRIIEFKSLTKSEHYQLALINNQT